MPRKTRSSHRFPAFYACYLLKSARTHRSTATYIGSTPNPPRRIRQHNGEITQGAWKTKHGRPWVMQMIVHGFPSRLAALQFEWAWQHPHISRHLRGEDGRTVFNASNRSKYLKTSVSVVQNMICSHPYNLWPLRVTLFTEEAVKLWKEVSKANTELELPPAFTCSIELEGVDGKSGKIGSARSGPIDVTDSQFTAQTLRKWTTILASGSSLTCYICHGTITGHPPDPLVTALCPTSSCDAISHLTCLSNTFLSSGISHSQIIPRGGQCLSCSSYILWGDVIRSCYRRHRGAVPEPEVEEGDDDDDDDGTSGTEASFEEKGAGPSTLAPSKGKAPVKPRRVREKRGTSIGPRACSEERQLFDLDAVSGSEGEHVVPIRPVTKTRRKRRAHHLVNDGSSQEGEFFDLDGVGSSSDDHDDEAYPTIRNSRDLQSRRAVANPAQLNPTSAALESPARQRAGKKATMTANPNQGHGKLTDFSEKSTQDLSKRRSRVLSPWRGGLRDFQSHVVLHQDNDIEAGVSDEMEARESIRAAHPKKHVPTIFPAFASPRSLYAERENKPELLGDHSNPEAGDDAVYEDGLLRPRLQRNDEWTSFESDSSEASRLTRALSTLSVSSDGISSVRNNTFSVPSARSRPSHRKDPSTKEIIVLSD